MSNLYEVGTDILFSLCFYNELLEIDNRNQQIFFYNTQNFWTV